MLKYTILTASLIVGLSGQCWAYDPTEPLPEFKVQAAKQATSKAKEVVYAEEYELSKIFSSAEHTTAVINGKTVSVGDSVQGATVKSIAENQVKLTDSKGQSITLHMVQPLISTLQDQG